MLHAPVPAASEPPAQRQSGAEIPRQRGGVPAHPDITRHVPACAIPLVAERIQVNSCIACQVLSDAIRD